MTPGLLPQCGGCYVTDAALNGLSQGWPYSHSLALPFQLYRQLASPENVG